MIYRAVHFLKRNIQGYHTDRKIVVIESDDWGSIKMPTTKHYAYLKKRYPRIESDPYSKFDSLEKPEELLDLFDVLKNYKDINGNHPKFTANAVIANPDFDKIKASGFKNYYHETVDKSFNKMSNSASSLDLWMEGFNNGLFIPQYHGREHLNVDRWILDLAENNIPHIREAFELGMTPFSFLPSYMKHNYMEGLDFFTDVEMLNKEHMIRDGFSIFNNLTGIKSKSFIANCYIWHPSIEETLDELGVKYIQGNPLQVVPEIRDKNHSFSYRPHYTGEMNSLNQIYLVRNVYFEPSLKANRKNIVNEVT